MKSVGENTRYKFNKDFNELIHISLYTLCKVSKIYLSDYITKEVWKHPPKTIMYTFYSLFISNSVDHSLDYKYVTRILGGRAGIPSKT